MEAIVNDKHQYMMFYSAKVGCTSMRRLYMQLHDEEFVQAKIENSVNYHLLNELFPVNVEKDYRKYYKFYISRNPYGRIVSAFLDQYVYARNEGVKEMLAKAPPKAGLPNNFLEFLEYLKTVDDELRDTHFRTQMYFVHDLPIEPPMGWIRRLFKCRENYLRLDYVGDLSGLNDHLMKVYSKIFKRKPVMKSLARTEIAKMRKKNASFYSDQTFPDAQLMSVTELEELVFAPKPQDFAASEEVRELIRSIYAEDFENFNYDPLVVPEKKPSTELIELLEDFDWETYLLLALDLRGEGFSRQREVTRHYLEFGRFESDSRFYKIEAPHGFVWQRYIELNPDLSAAGIDNERDAIIHYLQFGLNEGRRIA